MKIVALAFGLFFSCFQTALSQNFTKLKLGTSEVKLESIENKCDTLIFINLHNNEQTSILAIKQVLKKSCGKFLGIQSGKKRELTVLFEGKNISFDPNRIFTKTGIEKTLKNYNSFSESNARIVSEFAKELLIQLSKAELLVAVHNNTGGYSITGILQTNQAKHDALEININPKHDENDFYFVTQKSKFDYFKSKGYNVVLQDNKNVEDDGSLSVYCGNRNIDYINIECESGHLNEQIKMIEEIYKGFFAICKY